MTNYNCFCGQSWPVFDAAKVLDHTASCEVWQKKQLKCLQCDYQTGSAKGLNIHLNRRHAEGRVLCQKCHKTSTKEAICGSCIYRRDKYKSFSSPWANKATAMDIVGEKK